MFVEPFDMPDTVLIEPSSGLPINIPLGQVVYPGWQEDNPGLYDTIKKAREDNGIDIEDDGLMPRPKFVPIEGSRVKRPAPRRK